MVAQRWYCSTPKLITLPRNRVQETSTTVAAFVRCAVLMCGTDVVRVILFEAFCGTGIASAALPCGTDKVYAEHMLPQRSTAIAHAALPCGTDATHAATRHKLCTHRLCRVQPERRASGSGNAHSTGRPPIVLCMHLVPCHLHPMPSFSPIVLRIHCSFSSVVYNPLCTPRTSYKSAGNPLIFLCNSATFLRSHWAKSGADVAYAYQVEFSITVFPSGLVKASQTCSTPKSNTKAFLCNTT